mmetsp:Transcript_98803/g.247668  ORF Transcript_98803/g.247668 Transcript_98803/m.247668 type:complete len:600 (-) Transcript_98803:281-2080(-)
MAIASRPLLASCGEANDINFRWSPSARRAARGLLAIGGLGAAFFAGLCAGPAFREVGSSATPLALAAQRVAAPPAVPTNLTDPVEIVDQAAAAEARAAKKAAEAAASLYDLEISLADPYALIDDESLRSLLAMTNLPTSFDTRNEWLGCGLYVVDQGQCGDCWAGSAANTFGDRACIHLHADGSGFNLSRGGAYGAGAAERLFQASGKCVGAGTMRLAHQHGCLRQIVFPSPQMLVSCGSMNNTDAPTYNPYPAGSGYQPGQTLYPENAGCNGGEAADAWRFFYHEGITTMDGTQKAGCTPYTSGLCSGKDPNNNGCRTCAAFDSCVDTGAAPEPVRVDSFGWIMEEDLPARDENHTHVPRPSSQAAAMDRQVKKMQVEMLANGPLHVCIDDFANFITFFNEHPGGIYNSTDGSPNTGGHCIELIGWGVDRASKLPFWTFKNSWGPAWANNGYGRFLRGADLCGIESDVWAGCPHGSACKLTAGVVRNETWVPGTPGELPTAQQRRHATSASRPSRLWHGGREVELSREAFSHGTVAPLVVAAVRQATGNEKLSHNAALGLAKRVWARSVRGVRVRVEVEGVAEHAYGQRHADGSLAVA